MKPSASRRFRPPFSLAPLMLLFWGIVIGFLWFGNNNGEAGEQAARIAAAQSLSAAREALSRGDTHSADDSLEQAAHVLTGSHMPWSGATAAVGQAMIQFGQAAEAARFLQKATRDEKRAWDPMVWASLAQAYRSANDTRNIGPTEAEAERRAKVILEAIGTLPPKGDDLMTAAQRQLEAGMYYDQFKQDGKRALLTRSEAHRLLPDDPQIMNDLGYTLADRGTTRAEQDEAVILTRRAANLLPDDPSILDSYGWALFKRNEVEGARRILQTALDLDGEQAETHYHLAVVHRALGQVEEAHTEFDRALRLRSDYAEAKRDRATLLATPAEKTSANGT